MGPSGCGKTTLLNVLARREAASGATIGGAALINGTDPSLMTFRKLTSYVEQDDALIGSITVRETMSFAARLSHTRYEFTLRLNCLYDLTDLGQVICPRPNV
jgi:ABC-type multidrug transport system ATPase subunit